MQRRLWLCLYAFGTHTGLKRVLAGGNDLTFDEFRYVKKRDIHKDGLKAAIARVVNATLKIRQSQIGGEGTTGCASDSKKIHAWAWDQNLMSEWPVRYKGRGVMVYWPVEKNSLQKLSLPEVGKQNLYPNLTPLLKRPINWELIGQQYDQMIKYASALQKGTAQADSILRRFTRNNLRHPTYQALSELGRAVKTIFLCQYLESEELRQEIQEALNVVENCNSTVEFIFFARNSELASNPFASQEISILALHLLQVCLVYVNTLMIQ